MLKTKRSSINALTVLNSVPGNYLIVLPDAPKFTIVGATDSYLRITYTERGEITGRGIFEVFTDNPSNTKATGIKNLNASLHYVLEHKKEHKMENQRYDTLNPDLGIFETRIWSPFNKPVLDENNNVQYIIHAVEDITSNLLPEALENAAPTEEGEAGFQRKETEQINVAEQQQLFFSSILEASFNGIYALRTVRNKEQRIVDFCYLFANSIVANFIGLDVHEIIGKTVLELLPENKTNGFFDLFCRVLETGESIREETHFTAERFNAWFEYTIVPIDKDTLVVTILDSSEHKKSLLQIEQQRNLLEKYVEDLKRSNANLEEFAYAASHDLKDPIRKILFFSDRLKQELREKLNEQQGHYFSRMEYAAHRMSLLIDDLLTYSRISQAAPDFEEIDLNEKVQNVLYDLEVTTQEKGAEITVAPLPSIKGSRRQLHQLFQNVIGNALKYSKPNVAPEIHITCRVIAGKEVVQLFNGLEDNKQYHLIEVKDNGIGFEQEHAERIFNVFTRLHGNTEYRGTGIGLSIARKVMKSHNGHIWAESEPDKGATFKMLFPVN